MKRQRKIEKNDLIVTYFGGVHTYADAEDALNELIEIMKGKKYIYEVLINDEDIELNFNKEDEELLNETILLVYEEFEYGALAIVANNDLVFGLSRVLGTKIENERIAVSVFRTEDSAREWIQAIRNLHYDKYEKTSPS